MQTDESDERSELVLQIRERVAAGTYRVAVEDVADAIMAGPFPLGDVVGSLVGGPNWRVGGFGFSTDTAQNNHGS